VTYRELPGFVAEKEAFGETTVTIEAARIRDACAYARDELDFRMLVDLVATDYLGWASKGVSGYIATAGRDLNFPSTQGLQTLPPFLALQLTLQQGVSLVWLGVALSYYGACIVYLRRPTVRARFSADAGRTPPSA